MRTTALFSLLVVSACSGPEAIDAGLPDASSRDAGRDSSTDIDAARDAGIVDAALMDAAPMDATLDATVDAALMDAAPMDATLLDAGSIDAGSIDAAVMDASIDGGVGLLAPRPIAPLSTSIVTSRRPTLRWQLCTGCDGARLEICVDPSCATLVQTIDATGDRVVLTSDLPSGVVFWRLRGLMGGVVGADVGPTWHFSVPVASTPIDTSWGSILDIDADGHADLAIGAPGMYSRTGRAHVYLGAPTGIASMPSWSETGPDGVGGSYGAFVASAGDVNGDGYGDLAIGTNAHVYVYLGGAAGLGATPRRLSGDGGARSLGDLDGDGYGDLAISDRTLRQVRIHLGSSSGPAISAAITVASPSPSALYMYGVPAGDIDGDGDPDVAIEQYDTVSMTAQALVYLAASSAYPSLPSATFSVWETVHLGALDANGDGYADIALGITNTNGYTTPGYVDLHLGGPSGLATAALTIMSDHPIPSSEFGDAVTSAGDMDGDGVSELLVGDPTAWDPDGEIDGFASGSAHIYLGGASGPASSSTTLVTSPYWTRFDQWFSAFGFRAAGIGDVNGDGYADVAVGAPNYAVASAQIGAVFVYLGRAGGWSTTMTAHRRLSNPDGPVSARFGDAIARRE